MTMQISYKTEKQDFSVSGQGAADLRSTTFFECTLCIGEETMAIPVQYCTRIEEVKEVLAAQLGYLDPHSIEMVSKAGCYYKKLKDSDLVLHKIYVKGLKNFKTARHQYPHPYGIIGGGYTGLKQALWLQHNGSFDYVVYDRYDKVGGHTWLEMCNNSTKLQTEFPTYHCWYGPEFSMPGMTKCGGAPIDHEIWPPAKKVAEHFDYMAREFGILPQCSLGTNVDNMDMIGKVSDRDRYYVLTCIPVTFARRDQQGGGALAHQLGGDASKHRYDGDRDFTREPWQQNVSCLAMWPGALVFPRPVHYKGEDLFGGDMDFAVEKRFDYSHVTGRNTVIIGHGAFTMENIRTCLEERAKHIYVVCRKINLTCPRPVSWFINQSAPPASAAQILDMLQHVYLPMAKENGVTFDPWACHSVMGNSSRTHATIMQKTRFGIGDVYFLSQAYGITEVIVGEPKRFTFHCLHLQDGRKFECEAVLKCTGQLGDWKVDKLLKIKEMRGMNVNGDFRRVCSGEADGINASQFGATTGGPGYYGMVKSVVHFWDVPNDWYRLMELGVIDSLPVHRAGEPDPEFPAYFFTAMHAQGAGILLNGASPLLAAKGASDDGYKNFIQLSCIPPQRIIREAKADWDQYQRKFRENGMVAEDTPWVEYPFDLDWIEQQFKKHSEYCVKRYGTEPARYRADLDPNHPGFKRDWDTLGKASA